MSISYSGLPPKMQEQVAAKVAIAEARKRRESKYRARKVDGFLADGTPHTFDSRKEAKRYAELAVMERSGAISNLQLQVTYHLIPSQKLPNGKTLRGVDYIADFVYERDGKTVVEDVKGYRDPSSAAYAKFIIKKKLMLFLKDIEVVET